MRLTRCLLRYRGVVHSSIQLPLTTLVATLTLNQTRFLGKNLEHGLKKQGLLTFMRELDGNDNESIDNYLRDASMYARGTTIHPFGPL